MFLIFRAVGGIIIIMNTAWYLYPFWALFVLYEAQLDNKYILLDTLVCSIAVYYESRSILASPKGESNKN